MKVRIWGARGSLAAPGPETARYGGNTSCIELLGAHSSLVLDAGTGIRRLGHSIRPRNHRIDILLTHLHLDHIEGLGFFKPLFMQGVEVHVWGPGSIADPLSSRLMRFLSPPLFPVHLRDLPCGLVLHETPTEEFVIGDFRIRAEMICHPGPTMGYRIVHEGVTLTYMPDHEPMLGRTRLDDGEWVSGLDLASETDLLIHDGQYTLREYERHIGWGHSAAIHALQFAQMAKARRLVLFHHDPNRSDPELDRLVAEALSRHPCPFQVTAAMEGTTLEVTARAARTSTTQPLPPLNEVMTA
jgi:phosphoribosyl 1,2-cyclic phosphodiesterase